MTRLIDAGALIPMIKYATTDSEIGVFPIKIGFDAIAEVINSAPTVEAEPVRHGKWIDEGQYADYHPHHAWRCSECEEHVIEIDTPWFKYCPNCGARMEK